MVVEGALDRRKGKIPKIKEVGSDLVVKNLFFGLRASERETLLVALLPEALEPSGEEREEEIFAYVVEETHR